MGTRHYFFPDSWQRQSYIVTTSWDFCDMQNRKLLCSWCENEVVTTNTVTMLALKHCLIVATELVAMSIFVTKQVAAKLFFCIVYNISTYHIKNKLSKRFFFFIRLSLLIFFRFKKTSRCGMLTYPLLGTVGSVSYLYPSRSFTVVSL